MTRMVSYILHLIRGETSDTPDTLTEERMKSGIQIGTEEVTLGRCGWKRERKDFGISITYGVPETKKVGDRSIVSGV